jgi:hypothetical protein
MAKKMRRARRPQPPQSFRPALSQATPTPEAARPAPDAPPTAGNGKKVDFATEYFYVLHDLRTMGIIAAAMLAVLIVLSFIIH